jgi:hypothetical protein
MLFSVMGLTCHVCFFEIFFMLYNYLQHFWEGVFQFSVKVFKFLARHIDSYRSHKQPDCIAVASSLIKMLCISYYGSLPQWNEHYPWQLQCPLVHVLPSDKRIKMWAPDMLASVTSVSRYTYIKTAEQENITTASLLVASHGCANSQSSGCYKEECQH